MGVRPKTLPGLPLPEAWAVVSLPEVDSPMPWLLGEGEGWHWPLRGRFCFCWGGAALALISK